jgi:uncharacterized Zn-binding protein involved in type VI secretion
MSSVFANGRSIVHKGDGQTDAAGPPDVCKTPSPGGPVPVPYVNIAASRDLANGTRSVRIEGHPAGNERSNLAISTGDEAGTAGGGLMSSKIKGKLTWATKSADVKLEGKGAVRFGDTAQHNGNSFNTAFIQQGGTGMAYGDDFEGPCSLCGKDAAKHRIREMKASSAEIAARIIKKLHSNPTRYAKSAQKPGGRTVLKGYMVGVLVCNCKVWATTSGNTQEHFAEAAEGCVVIRGGGVNPYQLAGDGPGYSAVMDTVDALHKLRATKDEANAALRAQTSSPGECAAQKLLARAKGHELRSMSEVYFQPKAGGWRQNYRVRMTRVSGSRVIDMAFRDFDAAAAARGATDRSVASCHSCQLTLPFILCDLGNWKC